MATDNDGTPDKPPDEAEFDEITSREEFNKELNDFVERNPSMTAPELARAFASHLPQQNIDLIQRMVASSAYALLATRFRTRFSSIRNSVFASLDIPNVNPATPPPRRFETVAEKIEKWREWLPNKGHKLLLEMTMTEVNLAHDVRTKRMLAEAWRAEVLRRIFDARDKSRDVQLDDGRVANDELVSDKFSAQQIRDMIRTTRTEMYRGNLRIAVKATPALPRPTKPRKNKKGTE